jgi:septal ring-binding cell division protein DamX
VTIDESLFMIKGLLISINIIFLSLIGMFSEDAVSADAQLPSSAKSGEAFEVVVTIKKGSITEFAKFQYQLPIGFTAENIDSKTGSFSFAQQQVKIIWMALPTEAEFQIKFKVKSFPSTNGTYNLSGKFHYVMQGTKYEASTSVKTITVGTPSEVAVTPTKENTATTTQTQQTTQNKETTTAAVTKEPAKENTTTVAQTNTNPTKENSSASDESSNKTIAVSTTNTDGIELKRILSATQVKKGGSFMVDVIINKGSATGFAKIMETLPVGFVAEEVDAFGGIFSFQDNKVKILWMTMPASKEIKVKYKITVAAATNGKHPIEGFFSYLKESDGTNKKIAFSNSEIAVVDEITEEQVAVVESKPENTTTTKPAEENTVKTTKTESKTTTTQTVKTKEPKKENTTASVKVIEKGEPKTEKKTTSTKKQSTADNTTASTTPQDFGSSNPNQNLYYSVQICATKKQVDISYFVKNNSINEKIYTMMHEGWHKYVVGEFPVYKDARDHREEVKTQNKVVGPFVTAYNKGSRITVQEALMISGQKWIQ